MESINLQDFEKLGPFEIKDELIKLAKKTSRTTQSAFLNAGRGNPNWIATQPREGFFLLGQFAITRKQASDGTSRRHWRNATGARYRRPFGGVAYQARRYAWCTLSLSDGAVCGEEIWVRTRCICPRTCGLDHWRQLPSP